MHKKLNLGCGGVKKEGYVNLDWNNVVSPDIVHDLNVFPYPFVDDSFELIEADHVLEHLDKPFKAMTELHRILRSGGELIIKVPHFSRGFTHAEHAHGFDVSFPLYFNKKFAKSGFFGVEFEHKKTVLRWMAFFHLMPHLGVGQFTIFILRIINAAISFLANLSHNFCSRVWCFWAGGFEEIEFRFIKK